MPSAEIRSDDDRAEWVTPTLKILDAREAVLGSPGGLSIDGSICSADGDSNCS